MGAPSSKDRGQGVPTPVIAPYRSESTNFATGYSPQTLIQETAFERAVTLSPSQGEPDPLEQPRGVRPEESRYHVHDLLGEGGMGEVRSCTDLHIGREVAMKAMRPAQLARADLRTRFLREARIQGQLEHPAIVPVYDLGFAEEGALYFTMRRVRGETLETIVERLRVGDPKAQAEFTPRKLLSAFSRVCLAVHFAHTKGVVHRDLKPANVMLGDFGEVYVLDWGVAKLLAKDSPPLSQTPNFEISQLDFTEVAAAKTASGAIIGTPGYMAPEQILGQSGEVNAQTDVFALGAILFEVLTTEPLFGGGETPEVLARTLKGENRSAMARRPDRMVPEVLDAIVQRATSPYPEKRYTSVRQMSEEIEAYLSGDLDLERRQTLARAHSLAAREAAGRALGPQGTEADRQAALREVGRSLALDPEDPEALALLVRLVTAPPKELPKDVAEEVDEFEARRADRSGRRGALLFAIAAAVLVLPTAFLMGIRNPAYVAANVMLWGLAPAVLFLGRRVPAWMGPVFSYAAVASSSLIFGPFVSVPALAAVVTVAFVLTGRSSIRAFSAVLGMLTVSLPVVLELLHVLPRSFVFEEDRLIVLSRAVAFPSMVGMVVLTATHVITVASVAYYVAGNKGALENAEVQNRLQAWQLRQLVPKEAQGALKTHGRTPQSERLPLPPRSTEPGDGV